MSIQRMELKSLRENRRWRNEGKKIYPLVRALLRKLESKERENEPITYHCLLAETHFGKEEVRRILNAVRKAVEQKEEQTHEN